MVQRKYIYQYVDIFILYKNVITQNPQKCEYHWVKCLWMHVCQFPEILKKNSAAGDKGNCSMLRVKRRNMASSCYVQVCSSYANRNAGISLHLNPIENKNQVVWVWFVNTHWAHFNQMGRFVIFQRIFQRVFIIGLFSSSWSTSEPRSKPINNCAYLDKFIGC